MPGDGALRETSAAEPGANVSGTLGYTYRIVSVTALGGLLFGFDTAIINGALLFLRQQFGWTDSQTEIAAGSLLAGCVVGAAFAGSLSDRFGRKRLLLASAAIFALSSAATALPRTLGEFVAARIVAGVAIGIASMLAPLYIAEVSPERIRGRLVSLNQLAIVTGILLAYVVGWGLALLGQDSWRWMFVSAAIPSLLFLFSLLYVPESPRWLVKMGRSEEALVVLQRLGEPESRVDAIKTALMQEAGANLGERRLRKPLTIALVLAILQQVTGINTVLYYGSLIFREHAKAGNASAALGANVAIGLVNLTFTIAALLIIDRLGRRAVLMLASGGMAVSLLALCVLFSTGAANTTAILLVILCYVAFFAIGLGPGVWVVMAEIFPTAVRGKGISVATVALWLACLLVTATFLSLARSISIAGAFGLYAALCVFTVLFVWRAVPETNGRTLEEIESQWFVEKS